MVLNSSLPSLTSKWAVGLIVLPLAVPVTYLLYLDRALSKQFKTATGIRNRKKLASALPPAISRPNSLPPEVDSDDSEWVLVCERVVSMPVRPYHLLYEPKARLSGILTTYIRASMTAFSWTPQALILWACAGDSAARKTFNGQFIRNLEFRHGDRVNGFWRVVYRDTGAAHGDSERLEMALDPPPNYRGPVVRGLVVAAVEKQSDGSIVFVNETWMWRKQSENSVLLERSAGQWLHVLLSEWLVMKGLRAVAEESGRASTDQQHLDSSHRGKRGTFLPDLQSREKKRDKERLIIK
ncbi:hypothetical protein C8A03DRAFT_47484 [Achaetomium macrosporum]|uniref:Uncharacterized protein n=1 Tax=Achaetomium macrosporum TaxID=79813 RepID=A0AAN7C2P5_9PEZI|nr:hypothetical protein C8A03DRAFT_47484 [Achaetomium macrosporum]